jgi:uncharacterized membrane protein YbhN (UPF0104 family)
VSDEGPAVPGGPREAKGIWKGWKLLLQLLLTILVTWFILRSVGFNLDQLGAFDLSRLEPDWVLLLLSCCLLFGAYLYAAGLWGLMIAELGATEMPVKSALRVFFLANLGRYLPGKLWQIAGLAYLARGEGIQASVATGAAVLGQAFSLSGATLLGAGVLLGNGEAGEAVSSQGWALFIVAVLLVVTASPRILKWCMNLWFRLARQSLPDKFTPGWTFGVRWMGLYALGWIGQGMGFWMLARGLGLDLGILAGVTSYAAAYMVGYLALFAPAGVGVREGLLVALLSPILGAGAAILAIVARLWATGVEMVAALAFGGGQLGTLMKKTSEEMRRQ